MPVLLGNVANLEGRVRSHLEKLTHPSYLEELCRTFAEKEKRDIVYMLVLDYVTSHAGSSKHFSLAVDHFLRVWNSAYYENNPRVDVGLHSDLEELHESCKADLQALNEKCLGGLDTQDMSSARKLFELFGKRKSIAWTGASKALHMAAPHTFMMWDTSIREAYHQLHTQSHGYAECYLEFMDQSNELAKQILRSGDGHKITESHPSFVQLQFRKTLAKMIDECNYMEFTWTYY